MAAPATVFTQRAFHSRNAAASPASLGFDVAGHSANPWQYGAIQEQLDKLSRLVALRDGWNNGKGVAPSFEALTVAAELAREITLGAHVTADISPVESGGIAMEWECAGRGLQIEILPSGVAEFAFIEDDAIATEGTVQYLKVLTEWLINASPAYLAI